MITVLLKTSIIFLCLHQSITTQINCSFWALFHDTIGIIQRPSTNIREKCSPTLFLIFVYKTCIKEVVMIYLLSSFSVWIWEMLIKFSPNFLLGFRQVRSCWLKNVNTFMFVLMMEKIWLLWTWSLTAWIVAHSTSCSHLFVLFLSWYLTRPQSLFKLIEQSWILWHIDIIIILIVIVWVSIAYLPSHIVSYSFPLSISVHLLLEHYHYWLRWLCKQILEVHCIIYNWLCFDCFVKTKIVMSLLEGIKGDVSVELSHWMRFWIHIHFWIVYLISWKL